MLEATFRDLQARLDKADQTAVRDRRGDFIIVPLEKLHKNLQGNISNRKKAQLLLTEIGYLRCNLFSEYYERMKRAKDNRKLEEAVTLMQEYAQIAIPFVSAKKPSTLIWRIRGLTSKRGSSKEPDRIKDWKDRCEVWLEKNEPVVSQANNQNRMEEFAQLQNAFLMLYTYSFSVDNFPPLRNRRSDRLP